MSSFLFSQNLITTSTTCSTIQESECFDVQDAKKNSVGNAE
jgi:hypothetical protein